MKKITWISLLLLLVTFAVSAQRKQQLPLDAQEMLTDYYPSVKIKRLKISEKDVDRKYKVKFKGGTKMTFDQNGYVRKIKGKSPIPKEVMPEKISTYLDENYSGLSVYRFEVDFDNGYEQKVRLKDGTKLEFDKNGNFLFAD